MRGKRDLPEGDHCANGLASIGARRARVIFWSADVVQGEASMQDTNHMDTAKTAKKKNQTRYCKKWRALKMKEQKAKIKI
jgi:hypothetical protein